MTCNVLMGTLNPIHSLTHSLAALILMLLCYCLSVLPAYGPSALKSALFYIHNFQIYKNNYI